MTGAKMILWHCLNARSFRPLWTMAEMGLECDLRILPFPPRFLKREYLEENPLGTIPLLVDGDTRMTESPAISHYLATRYGPHPVAVAADEPDYGAYLNWLFHGEATLTFPQTVYLRYTRFEPEERRIPQAAEDYRKWFLARMRLLEATVADGRQFLCAGRFTNADISVGYAVMLADNLKIGDEIGPATRAWWEGLKQRPSYRAAKDVQKQAAAEQGVA